ncbi:MAG TPA: hypothetical protein VMP67_05795 [Candidatus Limnocylindria bacterium]|nr:hypothetical protein [Candidatus Limnocylindria bacterium]
MDVYLEVGTKRTFAGGLDWPGWCRNGRDEESALQALLDYGPRYGRVVNHFIAPIGVRELHVIERLKGDATTDFGAPGAIPAADGESLEEAALRDWMAMLAACWASFDAAVDAARGRELSTGPRGGGRALEAIVEHVQGAHASYARKAGGTADFEQSVVSRWRGEVPDVGPRGGSRWPPRYAIRRAAWHVLDHAWEIEDRAGLA